MSSSVSPCQWRYRGSGSLASRRGWPSAAKRLCCEVGKVAMLILSKPLRFLRKHLPYPRYRAAEENIATSPHSQFNFHICCISTAHKLLSVFASFTDLSTLNPQFSSLNHSLLPAMSQSRGGKREGGGEKQTGMYAPSAHPCLAFGKNPNEPTKVKFI